MQHEYVTEVVWQDKRVVLLLSTDSDSQTERRHFNCFFSPGNRW